MEATFILDPESCYPVPTENALSFLKAGDLLVPELLPWHTWMDFSSLCWWTSSSSYDITKRVHRAALTEIAGA